jgi:hypothetical protein
MDRQLLNQARWIYGEMKMRPRWVVFFGLLAFCLGCGRSAGDFCPLAGTVKYQGQPLDNATITFMTENGPAGGALIKRGQFNIPAEHGLKPGKYRAVISSLSPGKLVTPEEYAKGVPLSTAKELLPAEYNAKSTLTVDVALNKTHYDFDLR